MGPLRGAIFWVLFVIGACATPKKLLKDRMSQEHCKQKVAGLKSNAQSQPIVDVNPTCDIGKVSYMYSRGQVKLSFWRDSPYQICLVELKRFEVQQVTDSTNQQLNQIRDGENICFQNKNPNGGTVYVTLKPKGFTYISEIYYEIQRLRTSGNSRVNSVSRLNTGSDLRARSDARDQLIMSTISPPQRAFNRLPNVTPPVPTPVMRMRRPDLLQQRPVPSPLPLSRQWFLRQLPSVRNRETNDVWQPNNRQLENMRFQQELDLIQQRRRLHAQQLRLLQARQQRLSLQTQLQRRLQALQNEQISNSFSIQ